MAWKSATFKKTAKAGADKKVAISLAVEKHKDAMSGIIQDAKMLADERRRTLDSIKDPQLKRSAAL